LKVKCQEGDLFCLHFDGKTINFCGFQTEFIVVALTTFREKTIIGLKGLVESRTASSIFHSLKECIEEFNIQHKISMMISDTASVNTGAKSGVIKRLIDYLPNNATFYPCQLHVLDRSLKVFIEKEYLGNLKKSSPNIEIDIVRIITKTFGSLLQEYNEISSNVIDETFDTEHSRRDYQYLYSLWKAYKAGKPFPKEKFVLPPTNEARWNSRASYFFMAHFLLPSHGTQISKILDFISEIWCPAWFKAFKNKIDFFELACKVSQPDVKKIFIKNATDTPCPLDVPLTNEVAEWALGRLNEVKQPKKFASKDITKPLSHSVETSMRSKLLLFENRFLSFCNNI